MYMTINLTGYHGTNKKRLKSIMQHGIDHSDNGWFGSGSYFYKNSFDMAFKWAARKKIKSIVVLKADINVDEDKIFDLTDPLGDDVKLFLKTREQNFSKYKVKHRYQMDNLVINSLHKLFDFHVVKGVSHTYENYDETSQIGSNIPNGIEVVVRESSCIKSLKEVSE